MHCKSRRPVGNPRCFYALSEGKRAGIEPQWACQSADWLTTFAKSMVLRPIRPADECFGVLGASGTVLSYAHSVYIHRSPAVRGRRSMPTMHKHQTIMRADQHSAERPCNHYLSMMDPAERGLRLVAGPRPDKSVTQAKKRSCVAVPLCSVHAQRGHLHRWGKFKRAHMNRQ